MLTTCPTRALHLFCTDIKVREPNIEAMIKGRTVYDPPRFMTANEAIRQLLEIEAKLGKGGWLVGSGWRRTKLTVRAPPRC